VRSFTPALEHWGGCLESKTYSFVAIRKKDMKRNIGAVTGGAGPGTGKPKLKDKGTTLKGLSRKGVKANEKGEKRKQGGGGHTHLLVQNSYFTLWQGGRLERKRRKGLSCQTGGGGGVKEKKKLKVRYPPNRCGIFLDKLRCYVGGGVAFSLTTS